MPADLHMLLRRSLTLEERVLSLEDELLRVRKKYLAAEGRRQRCAYDRRFRYFQLSLMRRVTYAWQQIVDTKKTHMHLYRRHRTKGSKRSASEIFEAWLEATPALCGTRSPEATGDLRFKAFSVPSSEFGNSFKQEYRPARGDWARAPSHARSHARSQTKSGSSSPGTPQPPGTPAAVLTTHRKLLVPEPADGVDMEAGWQAGSPLVLRREMSLGDEKAEGKDGRKKERLGGQWEAQHWMPPQTGLLRFASAKLSSGSDQDAPPGEPARTPSPDPDTVILPEVEPAWTPRGQYQRMKLEEDHSKQLGITTPRLRTVSLAEKWGMKDDLEAGLPGVALRVTGTNAFAEMLQKESGEAALSAQRTAGTRPVPAPRASSTTPRDSGAPARPWMNALGVRPLESLNGSNSGSTARSSIVALSSSEAVSSFHSGADDFSPRPAGSPRRASWKLLALAEEAGRVRGEGGGGAERLGEKKAPWWGALGQAEFDASYLALSEGVQGVEGGAMEAVALGLTSGVVGGGRSGPVLDESRGGPPLESSPRGGPILESVSGGGPAVNPDRGWTSALKDRAGGGGQDRPASGGSGPPQDCSRTGPASGQRIQDGPALGVRDTEGFLSLAKAFVSLPAEPGVDLWGEKSDLVGLAIPHGFDAPGTGPPQDVIAPLQDRTGPPQDHRTGPPQEASGPPQESRTGPVPEVRTGPEESGGDSMPWVGAGRVGICRDASPDSGSGLDI